MNYHIGQRVVHRSVKTVGLTDTLLTTNYTAIIPHAVLNEGKITPRTVSPKKNAARPSTPFARVITLPTTKNVQNTKLCSNIIKQLNNTVKIQTQYLLTSNILKPPPHTPKASYASVTDFNKTLLANNSINESIFTTFISEFSSLINSLISLLISCTYFYSPNYLHIINLITT